MKLQGKYVASRYFNRTGTLLEGFGLTMHEARRDLKELIKHYRDALRDGTYLRGIVGVDGKIHSVARPNLALWLSVENGKKVKA